MDLLKELENDDEATTEIKSLIRFVTPKQLRLGLSEFWVSQLLDCNKPGDSEQQQIFSHVYSLLKFLEGLEQRANASETSKSP